MKRILDSNYESIVYLSHPYSGLPQNAEKVAKIINRLREQYPTYLFISPIHAFSYAYTDTDYETGISWCLWLLEKCDQVWVYGDWQSSKGCQWEIAYCMEFGIPHEIRSMDEYKELLKN